MERKAGLIREIGHFSTALFSLIIDEKRQPLGWDDCLAAWSRFRSEAENGICRPDLGLYLHIPLCIRRCSYCQIPVAEYRSAADGERLVAALEQELERYAGVLGGYPVRALAAGGGTPNLLTERQTRRLLDRVFDLFGRHPLFHFTLDISPWSAPYGKLQAWREYGVSRLSIGVQTLTRPVLHAVNRGLQSRRGVIRLIENARRAGIEAVCVDLIAGLPGETVASFVQTLETIVALEPDQIQIFRWILEPKCDAFATHGAMTAEQLGERDRMVDAAFRYLTSGARAASYQGEPAPFGLDFMHRRADIIHVLAQYEMLRSSQASILALGPGSFSHVLGQLKYGYLPERDSSPEGGTDGEPRPFTGSPLSTACAMACVWAAAMDQGTVERAGFAAEFGVPPEEAFPNEIAWLLDKGWLRRIDDAYQVPTGTGRVESIIAGALPFALEDLEQARRYQQFLETTETAR